MYCTCHLHTRKMSIMHFSIAVDLARRNFARLKVKPQPLALFTIYQQYYARLRRQPT